MRSLMVVIAVLSLWSVCIGKCKSQTLAVAPALYVFGDSLTDSGNNNWLLTFSKSNYKPYGTDFPDSIATGRFTNGKTVVDFIAEHLGLPYPTRVKEPNAPPSITGYTYASGGCGILPMNVPLLNCLDMTEQVRLFQVTKETVLIPAYGGETQQLEYHLANSIFFIWLGNNDYLINYLPPNSTSSTEYTPEEFADLLTLRLSEKLQALHSLGARKIVVFETPPFGCVPAYISNNNGECIPSYNENALLFNTKLKQMIQRLSSELSPAAYLTLGKVYDLTYDAILNPAHYGLRNVTGPCCQLASLPIGGAMVSCTPGSTPCQNRSEYLFWDGVHPTEASNSIISQSCITNPSFCSPFSIQDLVQLSDNNPSSSSSPPSLRSVI
ncbi:hypothetical protein RND81_08G228400 [Saponaria officinalis]|uniref:GDSL esterase/lipase n=1 Tax=Saponaria officinalis TaxID=3572 RepID=A0AAW1JA45_SAPOF